MPFFFPIFKGLPRRRRNAVLGVAAFAGAFLAFAGANQWLIARGPQWVYREPAALDAWRYRATTLFETLEHPYPDYIFYYGIGPAISYAHRADVLIIGNSLSLSDFTDEQLRLATGKSGLSFYNLSIIGSNSIFGQALMARQHLVPRLVLLSDVLFFGETMRSQEMETLHFTPWRAWVLIQAHSLYWFFQYGLQQCFPRWLFFKKPPEKIPYLTRSMDNGCIFTQTLMEESGPGGKFQLTEHQTDPSAQQLKAARKFKQQMDQQGTRIILVHLPSSLSPEFTRKMAEALQVPCILPDPAPFTTFDDLHLSAKSSEIFSKKFFGQLFELREFKELMREKRKGGTSGTTN